MGIALRGFGVRIQPIVEGHGERDAVPVLLRRLIFEAGAVGLKVARPIRQKQNQLLKEDSLKRAVELAKRQDDCGAILVIFDSEDDCPKTLGPKLDGWAKEAARPFPCAVVLAHREYEAWFLAAIESLRGVRGIRPDAEPPRDPEGIRGAKEAVEERMKTGCSYLETGDQAALSERFDFKKAYQGCRSFRRLTKAFGELLAGSGMKSEAWPPADWQA
jgi:hypothetical protein